jgi:hypothetical protein
MSQKCTGVSRCTRVSSKVSPPNPNIVSVLILFFPALPGGCKVLSSNIWPSTWTQTARISLALADGTQKQYLLKVSHLNGASQRAETNYRLKCAIENGEVLLKGQYESMMELHRVMPSLVPRPYYCAKLPQKQALRQQSGAQGLLRRRAPVEASSETPAVEHSLQQSSTPSSSRALPPPRFRRYN